MNKGKQSLDRKNFEYRMVYKAQDKVSAERVSVRGGKEKVM